MTCFPNAKRATRFLTKSAQSVLHFGGKRKLRSRRAWRGRRRHVRKIAQNALLPALANTA
jgi:hypothetical protein